MTSGPAAIAHGGADSPNSDWDGPKRAVDAALAILKRGGDVLDAVQAGTVVLEDDPRFNAGTGARIRLDGSTVQLDASIMSSSGAFGAVAAMEQVKNPVLVARAVLESPHLLVAGDGATRLARQLGYAPYDPSTEEVRATCAKIREGLLAASPESEWGRFDWRRAWNYDASLASLGLDRHAVGTDTVGCVARDGQGNFAAALSTGGTAVTLRGRIGDVPIFGAGLFAGIAGAVACTGDGERIVEATLARMTYERIAQGVLPSRAAADAVLSIKDRGSIGIILMTANDMAAACGTSMAWAGREAGSDRWHGPQH